MPGTVHDSLAERCMLSRISLVKKPKWHWFSQALICCQGMERRVAQPIWTFMADVMPRAEHAEVNALVSVTC